MNDILYEETATPYDYSRQKIFYVACKVAMILMLVTAAFFILITLLSSSEDGQYVFPLILAAWFVLLAVLAWIIRSRLYNCFDFIFVSGEVRIIKVVNTKKRKKMLVFDSKDVFRIGRFGSETYEALAKTPDIKKIFAPSNKTEYEGKPKYYFGTVSGGMKYLVVLECSETLIKHILQFSGRAVLEKEFR